MKNKPAESAKWKKWLIFSVIILTACSAILGFGASFILSRFDSLGMLFALSPSVSPIKDTNILLLGIDETPGVQRSDTIMIIHLDSSNNKVNIVSIPRDTLVVIPSVRLDKINHAYAFGGPELACTTTSNFLNVPVPYYIKINLSAIEKLVDRLGGVDINIEKKLYYVDYAGGVFIDLKPGLQRLTGRQALGYLRYRHDAEGDIGRIKRQQLFLKAVADEAAKSQNIFKISSLIMDLINCVQTNLSPSQIMLIASQIRQSFEIGNIELTSIPGIATMIDNVSYLQPEMDKVAEIASRFLGKTAAGGPTERIQNN